VGLVGNANYYEMLDFAAGLAGIDLSGDDGAYTGKWPWQNHESADRMMMKFQSFRCSFQGASGRRKQVVSTTRPEPRK